MNSSFTSTAICTSRNASKRDMTYSQVQELRGQIGLAFAADELPTRSVEAEQLLAVTTPLSPTDLKTATSLILSQNLFSEIGKSPISILMVTSRTPLVLQLIGTISSIPEGDQYQSSERGLFDMANPAELMYRAPDDILDFWGVKSREDADVANTPGASALLKLILDIPAASEMLSAIEDERIALAEANEKAKQGERLRDGFNRDGDGVAAGFSLDSDHNSYYIVYKGTALNEFRDGVRYPRRMMGKDRFLALAQPLHYLVKGSTLLSGLRGLWQQNAYASIEHFRSLTLMGLVDQLAISKSVDRDEKMMAGIFPVSLDYRASTLLDYRAATSQDSVSGTQFASVADLRIIAACLEGLEYYLVARLSVDFKGVMADSRELLLYSHDSPYLLLSADMLRYIVERAIHNFQREVAVGILSDLRVSPQSEVMPMKTPSDCAALLKQRLHNSLCDKAVFEKDPWPHNQFYRPDGTASRILNINSGGVSTHPPKKVVKDAAATVIEPGKNSKLSKKDSKQKREVSMVKTELAKKGKARKVSGDDRAGVVSEQKSDDDESPDPQPSKTARPAPFCANFVASLCKIKRPNGLVYSCTPYAGKDCKFVHPVDLKAMTVLQAKSCATFLEACTDDPARKRAGIELRVFIDANPNSFS
jgi:hypothetical protein